MFKLQQKFTLFWIFPRTQLNELSYMSIQGHGHFLILTKGHLHNNDNENLIFSETP